MGSPLFPFIPIGLKIHGLLMKKKMKIVNKKGL